MFLDPWAYAGCVDVRTLTSHVSLDLVSNAGEEVPHACQVGLALQLLVDAVVGTDRRLVLQVSEVASVTALTARRAHGRHLLPGVVGVDYYREGPDGRPRNGGKPRTPAWRLWR